MTNQAHLEESAVFQRVRDTVLALIEAGADAPTISFALAFIATEFGVYSTNDLTKVLPVVLNGVVRAAAEGASNESAAKSETEHPPAGATLH